MQQTRYTNRQIWHIAYPILISLIMEQMIGMTDTAFLGRVGEVELGASAIAGVFYMVIFMVAFGFSIGTQILIARRNGEENYREIGQLFYHGIYFQVALAAVMFLLSYFLSPLILERIISSPAVCRAAEDYLHWRVFGAFFSFSAVIFRAFFLGTVQTRTLTLNSVVMVLSNVVFNYILIFGNFGFPAMGIAGAALGSSLAEGVSLLFFILYTRRRVDTRKYGLDRIPRFCRGVLRRMLNVSLWTMIQNFFSLATWFLFFLYIEHLGERALAVTNIVRSASGLLFMVMMAFASTCGSLTSNLIGRGHASEVPHLIHQHIRLAYLFVMPLALLFVLCPQLILGIYTDMADLREAAIPSLWVMCASYLLIIPANVYFQSVSGTGNTRTALALELSSLVLYTAYITWTILILRLDVALCWTSEMVYGIFILLFCWLYIRRGHWAGKQI
ncbi:MATE family efflux transporter [Bacteroides sp. ET71]|uniref:MATE family efflux transporter n=1 Tax=Bacteroides sp. ET71 TaxID=2939421 RepID=UPI0020124248|nr:MATE family efflux transporter [Bacteroides sp. ET71]MCL1616116.1 MATE family efflux transporter [Bacteroides sp. ET71]